MRVRYFKVPKAHHFVYKATWHIIAIICDVFGRIELYGYEDIPQMPCIIVANHVSYLDPFAVTFFHETEMCAVARETLMDTKISGAFFKRINAVPVRQGKSGNLGTFRDVLSRIKAGISVVIFPEGTRSYDGKLLPGKPGAGLLAIKAGVPIIPIRTFAFHDVLPRSGRLRGGTRIIICAGKPISPKEIDPGKSNPAREQIIVDRIMERIAQIQPPTLNEV